MQTFQSDPSRSKDKIYQSHYYEAAEANTNESDEPIYIGHDMLYENDEFEDESTFTDESDEEFWDYGLDGDCRITSIWEEEFDDEDIIYQMTFMDDDTLDLQEVTKAEVFCMLHWPTGPAGVQRIPAGVLRILLESCGFLLES
jgi:hypothetical protein